LSTGVFKRATRSLFGQGGEPPKRTAAVAPKRVMSYHAVTIAPGDRCCSAAKQLQGHRFLSREAPKLPLANCDKVNCECRYTHHDDRRRGPRRAREMGVALDGYEGDEKRTAPKRGRRKQDK
jgi:hypothetical protein